MKYSPTQLKLVHVIVEQKGSWWSWGKTDSEVSKVSQKELSLRSPEWVPISAATAVGWSTAQVGTHIRESPSLLLGVVQGRSQALGARRTESPTSASLPSILHLGLVKAHTNFGPVPPAHIYFPSCFSAAASVSLAL